MSALPDILPEYLPARMLNEYVYCPRLFFYEWVEGVFAHNKETTEGALRHEKLETKDDALPSAEELLASGAAIHSRSVTLSSERYGLIAKLDLIEGDGAERGSEGRAEGSAAGEVVAVPIGPPLVTPVDYKRGSPREDWQTGELTVWDPERVQLAVQALVLRDNGYACEEGVIYYVATKQRVRVKIDEALVEQTLTALREARETATEGLIPPPLVDSPKCPRCSLVGI